MQKKMGLNPAVRMHVRYEIDSLRDKVSPFVASVAGQADSPGGLETAVLNSAAKFPDAAKFFTIDPGRIDETFGLRDEFLFAERHPGMLKVMLNGRSLDIDLTPPEALQGVRSILDTVAPRLLDDAGIRSQLSPGSQEVYQKLVAARAVVPLSSTAIPFAPAGTTGIFRLQHASLLYRTPTTGILVDAHVNSSYRPDDVTTDIPVDQLRSKVDAILISHFHEDHFFLASLLCFSRDTLIVVPKVPRSTIICSDMSAMLRDAGFTNVMAVDWYSAPLTVGDMRVHVLPFFGEQPLRFEATRHPAVRNWGNTYVIETDWFNSWFLIDSGADGSGSMLDVAKYVKQHIGPIDCVLSNLRRFGIHSPFYINGGLNWLTLAPRQLRDFSGMRQHCITLGPDGVADICAMVEARFYLPYAHWWGNVGEVGNSAADTPGQDEYGLVAELQRHLRDRNAPTSIIPWHVGDGFVRSATGRMNYAPLGQL